MTRLRLPGRRAQASLDALLALWAALWIAVGVLVAHEVRGLAELRTTVGSVGRAMTSVADTIRSLPLIGGQVSGPARDVRDAGQSAVASARTARSNARSVGTLLGVSIALIPTLPVLIVYLPGRIAAARERRALAWAVAQGASPWLDELLARRAVVHLPYRRLRRVTDDPLEDLRAGRHRALADAELRWFGVAPPRPPVAR
jgi:hypothetical protein